MAFLIVLPSLSKSGADLALALAIAGVKAVIVLGVILYAGQQPMRAWFHLVARQRSSELFVLNVLLITLGLAALTELAGLSLALGAFLAGMLIAETEYRYQVEEDIKPFRDVLLGLFFVTVGMVLDLGFVARNLPWVALLLVGPGAREARADLRAVAPVRPADRNGASHRLLSRASRRVRAGAARGRPPTSISCPGPSRRSCSPRWCSRCSRRRCSSTIPTGWCAGSRRTTGSRAPRRSRESPRRRWRGRTT